MSILAQHFHPIRLGEAGLGAREADWEQNEVRLRGRRRREWLNEVLLGTLVDV